MKKLISTLFIAACITTCHAQVIFNETFDGIVGPTAGGAGTYSFAPGWTTVNADNRTPAAAVSYVNDGWERREDFSFNVTDSVAFSTSWYSPAGASDDWMISPAIGPLPANTILSWNAVAYDVDYQDGYEVRIMTVAPTGSTGNLGNLVSASTLELTVTAENSSWTSRNIPLNAYAGQTIYVAFRNNSNDKFLLLIDDVKLEAAVSSDARLVSINEVNQYTRIPKNQVAPMGTQVTVLNNGTSALTDVALKFNVYDGTSANIYSVTGTALSTLAAGDSAHIDAGPYTLPSTPGTYTLEYIVSHSINDGNTSNDTLYSNFEISDSTYARDTDIPSGSLGIGAGNGGYLGNQFTINNPILLSSATMYVTRGYANKQASMVVWNMTGGVPDAIVAYTDTILYADDAASYITLNFKNGGYVLTPGEYVITAIEFDSTLALGLTDDIFITGKTWVNWPTSPLGGWGNNEAFGASFSKPYMIRMNLVPDCSGFSATATATDATCGTCADGSVQAVLTGGSAPFAYEWTPSGGTSSIENNLLPGNYTVHITDAEGCTAEASAQVGFTTGIRENNREIISIYPNPGKGIFKINSNVSAMDIRVTDLQGRVVYETKLQGSYQLDLSTLNSGKYIVNIKTITDIQTVQVTILQ